MKINLITKRVYRTKHCSMARLNIDGKCTACCHRNDGDYDCQRVKRVTRIHNAEREI
jgi:hypothetical protein